MADWPVDYDQMNLGTPHWTRQQALDAGHALATHMLASVYFADQYLVVVKQYYEDQDEHLPAYFALIDDALKAAGLPFTTAGCNAHDFANTHRAAWLFLFETFARLVDKNPHKDPDGRSLWGDPDYVGTGSARHRGISRGEPPLPNQNLAANESAWAKPGRLRADVAGIPAALVLPDYHNVPNKTGWFAISTEDVPPPEVRV